MIRLLPGLLIRTLSLLILGAGVLLSCCPFSGEEPPLPDRTFTQVLVEMHVHQARSKVDSLPSRLHADSLLHTYGVSRSDFRETLRYYSSRPEAFSSIYETVIDTLSAVDRRTHTTEPPDPDSLPVPIPQSR